MAEQYRITSEDGDPYNGEGPDGFHPNDLFNMIDSSYSKAWNDSNNLT